MQIFVSNTIQQTILFGIAFCAIVLYFFAKKKNYTSFSLTQELKGFAILAIVFAHIGYGLSNTTQFLFPFSILAGVGVNLFLFLSGYGLTCSLTSKEENVLQFYKNRLPKLLVPFWIVLSTLFLLDFFSTGGSYTKTYILQSALGIFTSANLYIDINSPFWYFTFILIYYLLFPLIFIKRAPWVSALLAYSAIWLLVKANPPFFVGVIGFYEAHMSAFPLGIFFAWLLQTKSVVFAQSKALYTRYERFLYPTFLFLLCASTAYLATHANIGKPAYIEETTSLLTMFVVILLFFLKKRESKVCMLFGFYSYEVYLLHWPLLYHYDILYKHTPAWLATLLYLGVFIGIAFVLRKLTTWVFQAKTV